MLETTKVGMPMEEFIRLYDTEGPFELIDGERKPIMPQVAGHGEVVRELPSRIEDQEINSDETCYMKKHERS